MLNVLCSLKAAVMLLGIKSFIGTRSGEASACQRSPSASKYASLVTANCGRAVRFGSVTDTIGTTDNVPPKRVPT